MTHRATPPLGAPCWADLWTSDVEGARRFYAELFGWKAEEPNPEFGGYFMFTREDVPVCGAMGPMGDLVPDDRWKVYLATDDIARTTEAATDAGAAVASPPMPVADLGEQVIFVDPTGAVVGAWRPETFSGFTVLDEPGTPSWFELQTREHAAALEFYRSVFRVDTAVVADSDDMRYSTLHDRADDTQLAGIADATSYLGDAPAHWTVYWTVEDADGAVARAKDLGGAVLDAAQDTPYGRIATVADPAGASFKLRQLTG